MFKLAMCSKKQVILQPVHLKAVYLGLFNIYTNDIASIENQSRFINYADSAAVLLSDYTHDELSFCGCN